MAYYVGLDVSVKETSICIMDDKGVVGVLACRVVKPLDVIEGSIMCIEFLRDADEVIQIRRDLGAWKACP